MSKIKLSTSGLCGSELVARWAVAHLEATAEETNHLVGTVIDGIKINAGHVHHGRKLLSDNTPGLHKRLGVGIGAFLAAAESIRSQSTPKKAHDSIKKAKKNAKAQAAAVQDEHSRIIESVHPVRKKRKDATKGKLKDCVLVNEQPQRRLTISAAAVNAGTDVNECCVPASVVVRYRAEIAAEFPANNKIEKKANEELLEERLEAYRIRHQD